MDTQNYTNQNPATSKSPNPTAKPLLKYQQEQWITYCALGGLITLESDDATTTQQIKQMTITQFADEIGVERKTLYNWKRSIPNFTELVRVRRNEVFALGRETVLFNRAYLIALTSKDHKAAGDMIKMLLGHGANLELPVQRQIIKNEGESWVALAEKKRQEIIEGEIVNDPAVS